MLLSLMLRQFSQCSHDHDFARFTAKQHKVFHLQFLCVPRDFVRYAMVDLQVRRPHFFEINKTPAAVFFDQLLLDSLRQPGPPTKPAKLLFRRIGETIRSYTLNGMPETQASREINLMAAQSMKPIYPNGGRAATGIGSRNRKLSRWGTPFARMPANWRRFQTSPGTSLFAPASESRFCFAIWTSATIRNSSLRRCPLFAGKLPAWVAAIKKRCG